MVSQRDVVLVPFPFSDLSADKFRPVVVMSNDSYNSKFKDFIAIPLTSNSHVRDHTVKVTASELESGSLPIARNAKVDRIFSLKQKLAKRKFGRLRQDAFDSIRHELYRVIE